MNTGEFDGECRCIKCNIDMGSNNPRQLCGKLDCDDFYLGIYNIDDNYLNKYKKSNKVEKLQMLLNEIQPFKESLKLLRQESQEICEKINFKIIDLFERKNFNDIEKMAKEIDEFRNSFTNNILWNNLLKREININERFLNIGFDLMNKK